MVKDMVCNKQVFQLTTAIKSEYQDHIYYFCSTSCKQAFDAEPEKYLSQGFPFMEATIHPSTDRR